MARIEDFGQKIAGAAKDRWRAYAERLGAVPDAGITFEPLSRSFPEPNYNSLLADGMDPQKVAFIHAIRDRIPTKPRDETLPLWARMVGMVRGLCQDLAEDRLKIDQVRERLKGPGFKSLADPVEGLMALYLALGHDRSFKTLKIGQQRLLERAGHRFDQPVTHWVIQGPAPRGRLHGPVLAAEVSLDLAVNAARAHLETETEAGTKARKGTDFKIYRRNGSKEILVGAKIGKTWIDLESFPSSLAARHYLAEHADRLEEKLERLRKVPSERRSGNDPRQGRDWRGGEDVGASVFHETFGFRGVQFGNYVEGDRRQQDLNDAWDALHDLADVLGWDPASLSLGGRLGLAFGARGRGGINAAAAHYEPDQQVINLTKTRGPGSFAHEWFHALDNAVARSAGWTLSYASEGHMSSLQTGGLSALPGILKRTGIPERSSGLDQTRRDAYWGTGREMAARSFEAWVIQKLGEKGARNDWLANIVEERVFEAEAALLGQPAGRYPYPRASEMPTLDEAFGKLLAPGGKIAVLFGVSPGQRIEMQATGAVPEKILSHLAEPAQEAPPNITLPDPMEEEGEIDWGP